MNERILSQKHSGISRFLTLNTRAYENGALEGKTKEIAGLAASMVLRCGDRIAYHVIRCKESGLTDRQLFEVFIVGLIVGGSIIVPHLRGAVVLLDEWNQEDIGKSAGVLNDAMARPWRTGRTMR